MSFSLRSALTLDIDLVTFVWLWLFYRTQDVYVSGDAALSSLRFQIGPTIRHFFAMACFFVYFDMVAISAPIYLIYITGVRLMDRNFSILLTKGLCQQHYRNLIDDTYRVTFRTSKSSH